jgi:hypothetical protein
MRSFYGTTPESLFFNVQVCFFMMLSAIGPKINGASRLQGILIARFSMILFLYIYIVNFASELGDSDL